MAKAHTAHVDERRDPERSPRPPIYGPRVVSKVQPGEWEYPAPLVGEFPTTRPTPLQSENDLLGTTAGAVTMIKVWDLAPIDLSSFDPFEPPGRPTGPPTNTVAPSITTLTTLEVGGQLVCSNGTWTGAPTFTRQWASGGNAIGGATGASYTIAPADVGNMILCRLTGANAGGTLAVDTAPVGPAVPARPTNTTAPVATAPNGAIVGQAVQTTNGAWTGSPTYAVQWRRGAANIAGATNNLYTLQAADAGQNVGSRITASNASGYPVTADSNVLAVTTTVADEPGDEPVPQPTRSPRTERPHR